MAQDLRPTQLASAMTSSATTATVLDGSVLPSTDFECIVDSEHMFVGSRSGNSLSSITRNYRSLLPAAVAHPAGSWVYGAAQNWFDVKDFGATGDGTTDDTDASQAAQAAAQAAGGKLLFANGSFLITEAHAFLLAAGDCVIGDNATIVVPDTAAVPDSTGDTFFSYNNGVFYYTGADLDDIHFAGLNFEIAHTKVSPWQVGVYSTGTGSQQGTISIKDCRITGGTYSIFNYCQLTLTGNRWEHTDGGAINAPRSYGSKASHNEFHHIGVADDDTVWNDVNAITATSSQGFTFTDNHIYKTGGSAIFFPSTTSQSAMAITVSHNVIVGAGLAAIYVPTRNIASSKASLQVTVTDNIIQGWLCGIGYQDHSVIHLGSELSTVRSSSIVCSGNNIDFCAPWETFDEATFTITGSFNDEKAEDGDPGSSYGIHCTYADDVVIVGNALRHYPRVGINLQNVLGGVVDANESAWGGWARDNADAPYQISNAVHLEACTDIRVTNTVVRRHAEATTASEFIVPYRIRNPIRCSFSGNSFTNLAGNVQNVLVIKGTANPVTQNGETLQPSMTVGENGPFKGYTEDGSISGSYGTGLDARYKLAGGEVARVRYTGAPFLSTTPGSRTLSPFHRIVVNTAANATTTLPLAQESEDCAITIKNEGTGTYTIARSGSDTIAGAAANDAIAIGSSKTYWSDGVSNWRII